MRMNGSAGARKPARQRRHGAAFAWRGLQLVFALVAAGVVAAGCASSPREELPPEKLPDWAKPGIVVGEGLFTKSLFAEDERFGRITDLAWGELDPSPGPEVGIVGKWAALFLSRQGDPVRFVDFSGHLWFFLSEFGLPTPVLVDADNDGVCEYFMDNDMGKSRLINHNGRVLWSARGIVKSRGAMARAWGDLDGDGRTEFVFFGYYLRSALNCRGRVLWRGWRPLDVFDIRCIDMDNDGADEILGVGTAYNKRESYHRVVLTYDGNGRSLGKASVPNRVNLLSGSVVRFPDVDGPENFLCMYARRGSVIVSLATWEILLELEELRSTWNIDATPVRLFPDQSPYLACLKFLGYQGGKSAGFDGAISHLQIFDNTGTLVYQDQLPGRCEALAAMPSEDGTHEVLLYSQEASVYMLEPTAKPGRPARQSPQVSERVFR